MKEIKAFIRSNKVNDVVHQLKDAGFGHLTISGAEGTGKYQDESRAFVSQKFSITDSKIAKLEMVVKKKEVDKVVSIISQYGKTIHPGDGIIYISDVEKTFRVKTALKNGD
ncbi:MAG: P-II family nitrogen regulator [Chlorobi bacterium]|nr:P-II family nitrogen regulator [Chlorobiota bacterium]